MDITSPEAAYVTKPNIAYPGTQAQADEVEVQALAQAAAQGRINGTQGGTVTTVPPGALATSGTKTTVERDGLKGES